MHTVPPSVIAKACISTLENMGFDTWWARLPDDVQEDILVELAHTISEFSA